MFHDVKIRGIAPTNYLEAQNWLITTGRMSQESQNKLGGGAFPYFCMNRMDQNSSSWPIYHGNHKTCKSFAVLRFVDVVSKRFESIEKELSLDEAFGDALWHYLVAIFPHAYRGSGAWAMNAKGRESAMNFQARFGMAACRCLTFWICVCMIAIYLWHWHYNCNLLLFIVIDGLFK